MSMRYNLFNVGFSACKPSYYFNRQALYHRYFNSIDENLSRKISSLHDQLEIEDKENRVLIEQVVRLAGLFQIKLPITSLTHENYFAWFNDCVELFEKEFPMTRIDYYYFFYARKLSEIVCCLDMLGVYLELSIVANDKVYFLEKAGSNLKDVEYILFKLIAPAALLSGEHRHFYFNTFYKEMCTNFEPFRQTNLEEMGVAQLNLFNTKIAEFRTSVMEGYSKCTNLLKDLGV